MTFSRKVSFQGKYGRTTSIRYSFGNGNTMTTGPFGKSKGVTYRTGHMTTRFSRGQAIGHGLKGNNNTLYKNKNLKIISELPDFS